MTELLQHIYNPLQVENLAHTAPDYDLDRSELIVDRFGALQQQLVRNGITDFREITRAYNIAYWTELINVRKSGLPNIIHQLDIALILAKIGIRDPDIYVKAFLHDTTENTKEYQKKFPGAVGIIFPDTISQLFGNHIGQSVESLSQVKTANDHANNVETHLKIYGSMSHGWHDVLIKMADRLDILRTIKHLLEHRRQWKAQETLEVYRKLASKLGMHKWERELVARSLIVLGGKTDEEREQVIQTLLDRYTQLYPMNFVQKLQTFLSDESGSLRSGFPPGLLVRLTPPAYDISHIFADDGQTMQSDVIDALYRHYTLNGEKIDLEHNKYALDVEVVVPEVPNGFHFESYVLEFVKRLEENKEFGFGFGDVNIHKAIQKMQDGQIVIECCNAKGQILNFRFLTPERAGKDQASLVDLDTKSSDSPEHQWADEKVKRLQHVISRINIAGRYSRKDIAAEFDRNLDVDLIEVRSKVDDKEYVFAQGAKVIDFAYAAGTRIGHQTVSADITFQDGTTITSQPLDTPLPPFSRIKLNTIKSEKVNEQFISRLDMTDSEYTREQLRDRIARKMKAETKMKLTPVTQEVHRRGLHTIINTLSQGSSINPDLLFFGIRYSNPFDRTVKRGRRKVIIKEPQRFIRFVEDVGLRRIEPDGRRSEYFHRIINSIQKIQEKMIVIELDVRDKPRVAREILSRVGEKGRQVINIIYEKAGPDPRNLTTNARSNMTIVVDGKYWDRVDTFIRTYIEKRRLGKVLQICALRDLK